MTGRANQLLDEVLKLTQAERAEIATALLANLDNAEATLNPAEVEAAWAAEIGRRLDRAVGGEPGVPWSAVKAEAEELLRRRKA